MGKLPAFQFYPGDWQGDLNLQSCSLAARGLWIELLCLMHRSENYGHLVINGAVPDTKTLSQLTRSSPKMIQKGFQELTESGVIRFTNEHVPYSKRMVEDAKLRAIRIECGKLGGNPALLNQKDKQGDNPRDNQGSNQIPTPSSSSSSSISSSLKTLIRIAPIYGKVKESYLAEIIAKFPKADPVEVLDSLRAWELDKKRNTQNPSSRLRNWFKNETKYTGQKGQVKLNEPLSQVGVGYNLPG